MAATHAQWSAAREQLDRLTGDQQQRSERIELLGFQLRELDALNLQRRLARAGNVRTRVVGEYGYGWMRLSTHVYNRPGELDRVVGWIAEAARSGVPARGGPA